MSIIVKTSRLIISLAREEDIEYIIYLENHSENKPYLWTSSYEEHIYHLESDDYDLLIIKDLQSKESLGYAMAEYDHKSDVYNLRRIAIDKKGQGYGKEAMEAIFYHCFEIKKMNRLWLDVYPDHEIGINLYESLNMHRDAILRENYRDERGYLDQVVYSLLKREYNQMYKKD